MRKKIRRENWIQVLIILLQLYVFTRLFTSFLDPILSPRQMRLHYEIVVLLLLIHCLFLTSLERYGLYDFFFFYYYSSQYCQGFMNLAGRPVAAFDPEGLIFAVGINSESVKLYDLRSFDKGPFSSFKFPSGKKMTKDSLNGPNFVVLCTYDFTRCNYNPSYFDLSKHTMWTVNDVPGKEPSGSFLDYLSNSVTQGHYWRSTVYLKFIYSKIFWEGHIILGNFHLT